MIEVVRHTKEEAPAQKRIMGSVHVLQPAIPSYRHDFFDRLSDAFPGRFFVHASQQDLGALTEGGIKREWARQLGPIKPLLPGMAWQVGAVGLPIMRGDILILSGAPRVLSNIVLMLRLRRRGVPVIWWGHYLSPNSPWWRRTLREALMQLASGMLFYTDDEVAAYRQTPKGRKDTRPLHALNNGLNIDPIIANRAPYDAASRPRDLLFIGRLTQKARINLAIEALTDTRLRGIRLQIIGSGDAETSARAYAEALGVGDRIVWHGAIVDEAAIAKIANACRVLVYPGSVGLSLIHGMAYGLPAIVHSDTRGHMPEIAAFADGWTGKTFAPNDACSLAAVVSGLMSDQEALTLFSATATTVLQRGYNSRNMVDRLVAALANFH